MQGMSGNYLRTWWAQGTNVPRASGTVDILCPWFIRVSESAASIKHPLFVLNTLEPVKSTTRTGTGRVGSARRRADGVAWQCWAEQSADIPVAFGAKRRSGPQAQCKTIFLNISSHTQTRNPMETDKGTKHPVADWFSAVYPQFIIETASALRCWLLTSVPTPICLCKPFSCKACPGKYLA